MSSISGHVGPRTLIELTEDECLRLLALDIFGRVVYTRRAMPAIVPVNYVLDGHDILLGTDPNSQLGRSIDATVVAFEVDAIDRATHTGWSVVVVGQAHVVRHAAVRQGPHTVDPDPWPAGARSLLVRLTPGEITGRRLVASAPIEGSQTIAPSLTSTGEQRQKCDHESECAIASGNRG